jgi:hypothetical protein
MYHLELTPKFYGYIEAICSWMVTSSPTLQVPIPRSRPDFKHGYIVVQQINRTIFFSEKAILQKYLSDAHLTISLFIKKMRPTFYGCRIAKFLFSMMPPMALSVMKKEN